MRSSASCPWGGAPRPRLPPVPRHPRVRHPVRAGHARGGRRRGGPLHRRGRPGGDGIAGGIRGVHPRAPLLQHGRGDLYRDRGGQQRTSHSPGASGADREAHHAVHGRRSHDRLPPLRRRPPAGQDPERGADGANRLRLGNPPATYSSWSRSSPRPFCSSSPRRPVSSTAPGCWPTCRWTGGFPASSAFSASGS